MFAAAAFAWGSLLLALSQEQPALAFESFSEDKAAELQRITDARKRAEHLTKVATDDDRTDLYFPLAELYVDKARYFAQTVRALDRQIQAGSPSDWPALERQRRSYAEQEERWRLDAIKTFKLAAKAPAYEKADQVLRRFGAFLSSVDEHPQAREVFGRLLEQHPHANSAPDAYVFLGELAFADGDLTGALALFEKVEGFPSSPWRSFAKYRKGWCQLKLRQYEQAMATFASVVNMCEREARPDQNHRNALASETKRDIAKVDFYRRWGQPDVDRMIAPPAP